MEFSRIDSNGREFCDCVILDWDENGKITGYEFIEYDKVYWWENHERVWHTFVCPKCNGARFLPKKDENAE